MAFSDSLTRKSQTYIAWRFYLILMFIFLTVSGLIFRVYDLSILDQHFLRAQGDERVLRLVSAPSIRGMIMDRNGFPLAVSTLVYSIWMNPQEFYPLDEDLTQLSKLTHTKSKNILSLAKQNMKRKREFVYLARGMSPELANQIKALNIPGIYLQQEYRRYYPEGEMMAHVIGFTNVDDHGQEGLELGYNQWLSGEAGKKWVTKDRLGRVISDVQMVQDQKPGHDLILSIDRRIQYLAYRELLAGVLDNKAVSGTAIVMDVKTGEILAMVNVPSFNPNNRQGVNRESLRNRAVTDIFEPGSTIKAFTMTSALESGLYTPDSLIDTSPGWMRVGHNVVKDEKDNGILSIPQILQFSSNMGVAKIVLSLPPDQLWSVLHRVGFGEETGIGFPGEQSGVLIHHQPWGQFILATLAFGYGMSATALQLTHAYSVLAANGDKLPLSLIKVDQPVKGQTVLKPEITRQILLLLESVFQKGGTAATISVPGYRMAAKTGTVHILGAGGYQKHRYNSYFVGIAPLTHPRFVVTVIINDPRGKHYYGGQVSGPVYQKIMEGTLRIMDVPPDAADTSNI